MCSSSDYQHLQPAPAQPAAPSAPETQPPWHNADPSSDDLYAAVYGTKWLVVVQATEPAEATYTIRVRAHDVTKAAHKALVVVLGRWAPTLVSPTLRVESVEPN